MFEKHQRKFMLSFVMKQIGFVIDYLGVSRVLFHFWIDNEPYGDHHKIELSVFIQQIMVVSNV